jgi:hypothetical protein
VAGGYAATLYLLLFDSLWSPASGSAAFARLAGLRPYDAFALLLVLLALIPGQRGHAQVAEDPSSRASGKRTRDRPARYSRACSRLFALAYTVWLFRLAFEDDAWGAGIFDELRPLVYYAAGALTFRRLGGARSLEVTSRTALGFMAVSALYIPLATLGILPAPGADAASLFAVAAVISISRVRKNVVVLLVALLSVTLSVWSGQRAVMVAAIPLVILYAVVRCLGRAKFSIPTALTVTVAMVTVVTGGLFLFMPTDNRLWASLVYDFTSEAQVESGASRLVQVQAGLDIIRDKPLFGAGLDVHYTFFDPGVGQVATSSYTHNTPVDLMIRFGVPLGAALFGIIVLVAWGLVRRLSISVADAWAAIGLALITLLVKSGVESVLFKPRLALIGALLLALAAAPGALRTESQGHMAERSSA